MSLMKVSVQGTIRLCRACWTAGFAESILEPPLKPYHIAAAILGITFSAGIVLASPLCYPTVV